MKPTLSVIIPALNEEANIAAAVEEVTRTLGGGLFADYELLLFDDGSTDRTGEIMDALAVQNPRVRVTHHPQPRNLGGVYKHGIELARFDHIIMVPGDNENPRHSFLPVLQAAGQADLITSYTTNLHRRPLTRRLGSRGYTALINLLFGHHLKYYNGIVLVRTADLRALQIHTDSFAYQSEILVKLLHAGLSYHEVGIEIEPRGGRKSKALKLRNLLTVLKAVIHLFWEIHFTSGGAAKSSDGVKN